MEDSIFHSGDNYYIRVLSGGATNFTWTFPSCPNGTPTLDPDPDCWFNYSGNGPNNQIFVYTGEQGGYISVWASNECGSSSTNLAVNFCNPQVPGEGPIYRSNDDDANEVVVSAFDNIDVYPNPSKGILTVKLNESFYKLDVLKNILVYDVNGSLIFQTTVTNNSLQINLDDYIAGVFYLKVEYKNYFTFRKIIMF